MSQLDPNDLWVVSVDRGVPGVLEWSASERTVVRNPGMATIFTTYHYALEYARKRAKESEHVYAAKPQRLANAAVEAMEAMA